MSGTTAMRENLRQMIAVLQAERQALAGLDLDAIARSDATRASQAFGNSRSRRSGTPSGPTRMIGMPIRPATNSITGSGSQATPVMSFT